VIFVVISVLVGALIYGSYPRSDLFAVIVERGLIDCVPFANVDEVQCCQTETDDKGIEIKWCTDCVNTSPPSNCGPRYQEAGIGETPPPAGPSVLPEDGVFEQPPTFSPFNPAAPLQGGVSEQQPQTPPPSAPGTSPGILEQLQQGEGVSPGFLERQQTPPADEGATELPPPATEQTQPATVEEEQSAPVCQEGLEFNEDLGFCVPTECPEGQVLDEEAGVCVLEEPEVVEQEEPEQQSEPEEQDQQQSSEEEEDSEDNTN
jgi:hypothetical protein